MFEYFNTPFFIVMLVLSPLILYKGNGLIYFLFGFIIFGLFYTAYDAYSDAKSNLCYFQEGNTLVCFSGGGMYTSANRYSVSKEQRWQMQKNYFKKDSLMIRADKCEHQ
jgi:hypothetical protein